MEKYLGEIKSFIKKHQKTIKTMCLPCLVGVAVLFFWLYGGSSQEIETNLNQENPALVSSQDEDDQGRSDEISLNGEETDVNASFFVDISGSVINPGVYEVKSGQRIFHVIELAGGLKDDANINIINQAEQVYDGQKIIIPSVSEKINESYHYNSQDGNIGLSSSSNNGSNNTKNGKVDINTAGLEELQTLPGIGATKSSAIIEYREKNGNFAKIEDIKNVSGIGSNTFDNLKDKITV